MALREDRAGIRLLFDENLPWRVAAALQVLEFAVSFVGDDSASPASPRRGSEDEVVLSHASGANQIIVTSNLDMIRSGTGSARLSGRVRPLRRRRERPCRPWRAMEDSTVFLDTSRPDRRRAARTLGEP